MRAISLYVHRYVGTAMSHADYDFVASPAMGPVRDSQDDEVEDDG